MSVISTIPNQNKVFSRFIPFTYTVRVAFITGSSVSNANIIIDSDSTFELHQWLAISTAAVTTLGYQNGFSIMVTDATLNRQMSDARIPQALFAGSTYTNGASTEKMHVRFTPNTVLLLDLLDLTNSRDNVAYIGMKGYKLYL